MADYNGFSDEQLASLLREGDDRAFTEIYNRFWKVLLNQAFQRLKSVEASEELVQDLFISFYQRREEVQIQTTLNAYLMTALKYRIFNAFRARKVELSHQDNLARATYERRSRPNSCMNIPNCATRSTWWPPGCRKNALRCS